MVDVSSGAENKTTPFSVLVIGGGWSGLYAAKNMLSLGHNVRILEQRAVLGGVWAHEPSPRTGYAGTTVAEFTETTTSRITTSAYDFEYTDDMTDFPIHYHVHDYLQRYADHFNLTEEIIFNTKVTQIEKDHVNNTWHILTQQGAEKKTVFISDLLIVCTGALGHPWIPPRLRQRKNLHVVHSHFIRTYKDIETLTSGKNVLVYGGGETASDILLNVAPYAARVTWGCSSGLHGFRKRGFGVESRLTPYDEINAMTWNEIMGLFRFGKPGNLFYPEGHSIPSFQRNKRWGTQFFNKNIEMLPLIGKHIDILHVTDENDDEESEVEGIFDEYDVIIACTGYQVERQFPKLPSPDRCYKFTLSFDDPTLAYVGIVRPTITSFPFMSECSCRLLSYYWSHLKFNEEELSGLKFHLQNEHTKFLTILDEFFDGQRNERLQYLVDPLVFYFGTYVKYAAESEQRWVVRFSPNLLLVSLLCYSPLEMCLHYLSGWIPDWMKRWFTFYYDNTIYMTKSKMMPQKVLDFYSNLNYCDFVLVDGEFEKNVRKYTYVSTTLCVVFVLLMCEVGLILFVPFYWLFFTAQFVFRFIRVRLWVRRLRMLS